MKKYILITGGAGYIGSTTAKLLQEEGYSTITLDNLSTGLSGLQQSDFFYEGSTTDEMLLDKIFSRHSVEAVLHFAASSLVAESTENPMKYYRNNLLGSLLLLEKMHQYHIKKIIFSSSAAVYGETKKIPITEKCPIKPLSPYGRNKAFLEDILEDYHKAYHLSSISLRYFNACGTEESYQVGEVHTPESHLIPLLVKAALENKTLYINGNDYKTHDGTCVRDYIHVSDLAKGHLQALRYLEKKEACLKINLSTGKGFSILDIIKALEKILGKKVKVEERERRAGDPAILIGEATKARKLLHWEPHYTEIEKIIETAYLWQTSNKFKALSFEAEKNSLTYSSKSSKKPAQTEIQEYSLL